ncbi:GH92 family glycosyl hydrolase [Autumnicola musiva]|uniref:GH92 family glycosyl hydrolase n=1 Tax=Autumnicola musiva TaxID=3075589 RepID=UPI003D76CC85
MKLKFLLLLFLGFTLFSCQERTDEEIDPSTTFSANKFVNPFIGTGGHGHTFPGASSPFGMIQASPVNGLSGWDWCSGYHYSDSLVAGFTALNLSGTGIGDLADLLVMPVNKPIDLSKKVKERNDIPYISKFSHEKENAEPGYYSVFLDDFNVKVEMTTSERVAYHHYTFDSGEPSVIMDLGFAINWDRPVNTNIKLENDSTLVGHRHSSGWAKNQKLFFVLKFSEPVVRSEFYSDLKKSDSIEVTGRKSSVQLFFDPENVKELDLRLAISSVSIENAIVNLNSSENSFSYQKEESFNNWNNVLNKIEIETPQDSLKTIFYSALYHTQLSPVLFSDTNGQFRLENDSIATGDFNAYSTLSLWDTFRAEQPLLSILQPERVADIIKSMLVYYEVNKSLPVWTLYGNETNTMTGYHSIPIITEAYFKGIRDFDVEKAYDAMKNTMMQDKRGLEAYRKYGFIPYQQDESVTMTLEYAYNDWCVAQMAKALNKTEDYEYFLERSRAYEKVFDLETKFMRGRDTTENSWREPFDPKFSKHMTETDYTEGNAWQHSWFVLHDTENFVEIFGGADAFTEKLEQLFTESSEITGEEASADISGLIGQYAHGNEPSHHIAYLFNRAGKPWRTQYWVKQILDSQYNTTPNGYSGNEDAGQMSAWYVFSSMGLYPFNPAGASYEIGTPLFEKSTITLDNGKTFVIEAKNVSSENYYIQSAEFNGEPFNRTSISHEEILNGGKLLFEMGNKPNKNWGLNKEY